MSRTFGTWWPLKTLDRWLFPSRWRGRRRTIPVLYLQTTRTSLRREKSEQLICLCALVLCHCCTWCILQEDQGMVWGGEGSKSERGAGTTATGQRAIKISGENQPPCKTEHHMFIAWIPYALYSGMVGLQLRWLALSMYLGLELPIRYVMMKMEIGTVQRLTHSWPCRLQVELSSFSRILYMCVCRNGWRRQGTRKRL